MNDPNLTLRKLKFGAIPTLHLGTELLAEDGPPVPDEPSTSAEPPQRKKPKMDDHSYSRQGKTNFKFEM